MIRRYVESMSGTVPIPPDPLGVTLTSSGSILTAMPAGGVPPYHFIFSCSPSGTCNSYSIDNPNQSSFESVFTHYLATAYGGSSYLFRVDITDSAGHSNFDNYLVAPCLVPETLILMRDGNYLMLKDVKIDDRLFDSVITHKQEFEVNRIFVIDTISGQIKTSKDHANILSNGDLIVSEMLEVGMELIDKDFKPLGIINIEIIEEITKVINISTDTETYIANGIRTHNKLPC